MIRDLLFLEQNTLLLKKNGNNGQEIPFNPMMSVPRSVEIDPVVWEKTMRKVYKQLTDRQTTEMGDKQR